MLGSTARWLAPHCGRRGDARSNQPNANQRPPSAASTAVAILALPELAGREPTDVAHKTGRVNHSTCLNCGRADRLGFADESVRASRYRIAVVVVCQCQVGLVRKVMRGLVRPGLRRVHFSKQQDGDRRLVVTQIVLEDIRALVVTSHGRQVDARSECWTKLVPQLVEFGITELIIERVQGSEARDRRDISAALKAIGQKSELTYQHAEATGESMLWVADAVAWCAGAGSHWRMRIAPILYQ